MKCGDCSHFKKVRYSNYFECTKYGKILTSRPPEKCEECIDDDKKKKRPSKKDYIEVR